MRAAYGNSLFRNLYAPNKTPKVEAPDVKMPATEPQGDNTSPDLKSFDEHNNAELIDVARDIANATSAANSMPGRAIAAALGLATGMPVGLAVKGLSSLADSQTLGAVNGRFGTDYNDLAEAARDLGMRAAEHAAVGSDRGLAGVDAGLNDEAMGRSMADSVAGQQAMSQMDENDQQGGYGGNDDGSSGQSSSSADGGVGSADGTAWHTGGYIKADDDGAVEDVPNQTLQEGEYVLNRATVNKIGKNNLDKLNNFPGDADMLRRALERILKG